MRRESHVRFCEGGGVRFPSATRLVVLCDSMEKAQEALALIRAFANENGLTLHPAKTHIGDCRIKGQGFEFLGYRFEAGHRFVRKKSLLRLRDRIRAKTKRTSGQSLARTIAALNPTLKGWFGYFKHATSGLKDVDAFVRRRLRAMLRKQAKRHGCGTCRNDRIRWPNLFFASAGLFALDTAWRQERGKPPTGEPDAGKPPVRLCVQRRLACSAGERPAGARIRGPVVWIAGWRETKTLKPIDNVSRGEATSHRAVTTVNAKVASKVSSAEGRAPNRRARSDTIKRLEGT